MSFTADDDDIEKGTYKLCVGGGVLDVCGWRCVMRCVGVEVCDEVCGGGGV